MAEDLQDIKRSMTLQMQDVSGETSSFDSHHVVLSTFTKSLKRFQRGLSRAPHLEI